MEFQQEKRSLWSKLRSFFIECRRVYKVTKKPSSDEFKVIVKVTAIGILIIGAIGFAISMVAQVIS